MPKVNHYHSGGLAEIVEHPSAITANYLLRWFDAPVIARGLKLLKLPDPMGKGSLLAMRNGELFENLSVKNQIILGNTLFEYRSHSSHSEPAIHFSWSKIVSMSNWLGTTIHILRQSTWLANQPEQIRIAGNWVKALNSTKPRDTRVKIEEFFEEKAIPVVFAVNFLGSFYEAALKNELGARWPTVSTQVAGAVKAVDWFTEARLALFDARQGKRTLESVRSEYGLVADSEFELTIPRWHEPAAKLADKMKNLPQKPPKHPVAKLLPQQPLVNTVFKFQYYRIEVKKALLPHLNALRQVLLKEGAISHSTIISQRNRHATSSLSLRGTGTPVSPGKSVGTVTIYHSPTDPPVANTIGVFPSAGPAYTEHFLQSKGLIFKKGGMTSHGAIVAREFGLPAIVCHNSLPSNGQTIELNGSAGTWRKIPSQ